MYLISMVSLILALSIAVGQWVSVQWKSVVGLCPMVPSVDLLTSSGEVLSAVLSLCLLPLGQVIVSSGPAWTTIVRCCL